MNKIKFLTLPLMAVFFTLFTWSCNNEENGGKIPDTPVRGSIKISVDESLEPLADSEVKTFMQIYDKAHITPSFKSEAATIKDMYDDSARMIIIPRPLTNDEQKFYTDKHRKLKMVKIAYDAIALIVNKNNPDSTLTLVQLQDMMHGSINNWSQLSGRPGKINVVFDNAGSSTLEYMKKRFGMHDSLPANFFAVHSNSEVINYIEKTPDAIGFIGVNWISNEATTPNSFINKIKVVALSPPDTAKNADQKFYPPYQAWISTRYYPLIREVYAITPEFFNGLGSGFITFMAGDKGQIKVLQSGLLPATMPMRIVHSKKDF